MAYLVLLARDRGAFVDAVCGIDGFDHSTLLLSVGILATGPQCYSIANAMREAAEPIDTRMPVRHEGSGSCAPAADPDHVWSLRRVPEVVKQVDWVHLRMNERTIDDSDHDAESDLVVCGRELGEFVMSIVASICLYVVTTTVMTVIQPIAVQSNTQVDVAGSAGRPATTTLANASGGCARSVGYQMIPVMSSSMAGTTNGPFIEGIATLDEVEQLPGVLLCCLDPATVGCVAIRTVVIQCGRRLRGCCVRLLGRRGVRVGRPPATGRSLQLELGRRETGTFRCAARRTRIIKCEATRRASELRHTQGLI